MRAAFYRPDEQKLLMCPLIKRLNLAFVWKYATNVWAFEKLSQAFETLGRAFNIIDQAFESLREK